MALDGGRMALDGGQAANTALLRFLSPRALRSPSRGSGTEGGVAFF